VSQVAKLDEAYLVENRANKKPDMKNQILSRKDDLHLAFRLLPSADL
jgi:hypothetical protein